MDTEGLDADNEGAENGGVVAVDANALPPDRKLYLILNPPNINCNDEIST